MGKKKEIIHGTCGGRFETKYNDNSIPYLECVGCGRIVDDWIKWQETYSKFYLDEEKWSSKKDHLMCLLGYFCSQYTEHYGTDFVFSLDDKGLFGGKEVHFIRKVYSQLGNDVTAARAYIQWIFADKVARRKKRITGLSFLAVPELIQEFKLTYSKKKQITRNKPLPPKMIQWVEEHAPQVISSISLRDWGELKMALDAYRSGILGDIDGMRDFVGRLQANSVIDSDLKIIGWVND